MPDPGLPHFELLQLMDGAALQDAVRAGERVLVGVSGGADSVALLRAMKLQADASKFDVFAVHVNHGLRPESADEERFVDGLCASLDIPCSICHLTDAQYPKGGSAEAWWRRLRYDKFREVMLAQSCDVLALGHNADDLAETFLFHLVRGTGVAGLVFSFQSCTDGMKIIRPLWKTRRTDIEQALKLNGQTWIEDASNENVRHSRNLIRHEVLPVLQKINPDVVGAIVRASEAISNEIGSLEAGMAQPCLRIESVRNDGPLAGDLRMRVLNFLRSSGQAITSRQLEQAMRMILQRKPGTVALTGKTLVIAGTLIWISDVHEPDDRELAVEHVRRFGGFYAELNEPVLIRERGEQAGRVVGLDGAVWAVRIAGFSREMAIVNRGGGMIGGRSLKKLLNEAQVPWYLRDRVVFIADSRSGDIVASVGDDDALNKAVARKVARAGLAGDAEVVVRVEPVVGAE